MLRRKYRSRVRVERHLVFKEVERQIIVFISDFQSEVFLKVNSH